MTLTIYWIRHGLSCANIHKYTHAIIKDPKLSYDGIECSDKIANHIKFEPDLIISSTLRRAMETALSMFKKSDKPIISFPYISEKGLDISRFQRQVVDHL